jgi:quinol monooxygenase YgiN
MAGLFPRSNFVVTARFVIRPDSVNKMRVIAHDLTTASRADTGCILYHFAESAEKEGVFSLTMVWRDEVSYQRYAASDSMRVFSSILSAGMLESQPAYETWRSLG